jgi:hypothetical protein
MDETKDRTTPKQDAKYNFLLTHKNLYNHGGHRPPSLIFIENKIYHMTHFYSKKLKMKLGSGEEPHPL